MKVYVGKPPKPGGPERFTIGERMARLTDKQYKKLGFYKPLQRLAKLLRKTNLETPASTIGIEIKGIAISFLLGPDPSEKKAE